MRMQPNPTIRFPSGYHPGIIFRTRKGTTPSRPSLQAKLDAAAFVALAREMHRSSIKANLAHSEKPSARMRIASGKAGISSMQEKPASSPLKPVFVAFNPKGGVGKSTTLETLIYSCYRQAIIPLLVDADEANPDIKKAHGGVGECMTVPASRENGYVTIANVLDEERDRVIMISGPAGSIEVFRDSAAVVDIVAGRIGRPLIVIWPIDLDYDSHAHLPDAIDAFPNSDFVVVRNGHFGRPEDFQSFNGSNIGKMLIAKGKVVDLPVVPASVMRSFKTERMSFYRIQSEAPFAVQAALELFRARAFSSFKSLIDRCSP